MLPEAFFHAGEEMGVFVLQQLGEETKLGGVYVPYLSILDMAVDPRWGRTEECFSEDPYLAAKMCGSAVRGIHNSGNMICAKHFAGQGAAQGGHTNFLHLSEKENSEKFTSQERKLQ